MPDVYVNLETLDAQRVFCGTCRTWVDLDADAGEAVATLAPWDDPGPEDPGDDADEDEA